MTRRGVSEVVSVLLLAGVTAVAFVAIMYVVPSYFARYLSMGADVASNLALYGIFTDGHLKRVGSRLVVFVYNHGDRVVAVDYTVFCETPSGSVTVGVERGVVIGRGSLHVKVYPNAPSRVCYLVVEEPNLVTYKVVES